MDEKLDLLLSNYFYAARAHAVDGDVHAEDVETAHDEIIAHVDALRAQVAQLREALENLCGLCEVWEAYDVYQAARAALEATK